MRKERLPKIEELDTLSWFQIRWWYDELYLKWFDVGLSPEESEVFKAIQKRLGK